MSADATRAGRCNCEHIRHEYEDGGSCPGGPRQLGARADFVGAVCDTCARECVREYLIEVNGRCPRCAGVNGLHHAVHVRYGNGGGGNRPCSLDEDRHR